MQGVLVGLAKLLAEEIDGDQRGHKYCDNHCPAANLFAGKSKIVKCHIPQSNRDILLRGSLRSIPHQIVIAAQYALDVECGASRGIGISGARGQHT